MADLTKVKVEELVEQKKKDGNSYWIVKSEGKNYVCYDSKIKEFLGKEVECYINGKESTGYDGTTTTIHYLNFPKKGGFGFGRPQANPDTMILAYAKDIIVARMQCSTEIKTLEQLEQEVRYLYKSFKKLLEVKEEKREEKKEE